MKKTNIFYQSSPNQTISFSKQEQITIQSFEHHFRKKLSNKHLNRNLDKQ